MEKEIEIEKLAGMLYSCYCAAVGGKAWNGDQLPEWETFANDKAKEKQANAWRHVAKVAKFAIK